MLFVLIVIVLFLIFLYNYFFGNKGTYMNHTNMIWSLLQKNRGTHQPQKKVSFESKGETEARRVIEKITGLPFPRARPNFLKNTVSGSNLELDCFNPEMKLALEYNGEQHYKYIPYFHQSKDAFYNVKYRDEMKNRLCKENGVTLITIPYTVKHDRIEDYIKTELKAKGL